MKEKNPLLEVLLGVGLAAVLTPLIVLAWYSFIFAVNYACASVFVWALDLRGTVSVSGQAFTWPTALATCATIAVWATSLLRGRAPKSEK